MQHVLVETALAQFNSVPLLSDEELTQYLTHTVKSILESPSLAKKAKTILHAQTLLSLAFAPGQEPDRALLINRLAPATLMAEVLMTLGQACTERQLHPSVIALGSPCNFNQLDWIDYRNLPLLRWDVAPISLPFRYYWVTAITVDGRTQVARFPIQQSRGLMRFAAPTVHPILSDTQSKEEARYLLSYCFYQAYFPYHTPVIQNTFSAKVLEPTPPKPSISWNHQQMLKARAKIAETIDQLMKEGSYPTQTTERCHILRERCQCSPSTLYAHKDLWHPQYVKSDQQTA